MPVFQQGQINTTALIVPDVYVQIISPQVSLLNGVPTNILGVVGTAQWGPVNSPTTVSNYADFQRLFGNMQPRKYDAGSQVAAAVLQGANNFRVVRVTDGTDTAANVVIQTTGLTLTASHTGTLGNFIKATLSAGAQANTVRVVVSVPGLSPEVFDNIGSGLTGNALWLAIANAINNGIGGLQGPSEYVVATAGVATAVPTLTTYTLAGGLDGVTTITSAVLVGADTTNRTGMYALRNTGTSIALLADADDSAQWTLQAAYGLSEGTYMIGTGPSGDTITNALSVKSTAGIDSYAFRLMFGDWALFQDTINGIQRLISPQGFIAGMLANLSPEQSALNKPMFGIIGTQKTLKNQTYSSAELQQLQQAGIDVITNPIPYGSVFGSRLGHNTSSNAVINGDNYTRLTNYLAYTFNAGMGKSIGKLQSKDEQRRAASTLGAFLEAMKGQGMIDDYSVQINDANNPPNRVALGYMQADVQVRYLSVIEKFLINLEGGQSVTVNRVQTTNV